MYLTVELEHYIYATNQVFQINILSTLIKICCSTWEKKRILEFIVKILCMFMYGC